MIPGLGKVILLRFGGADAAGVGANGTSILDMVDDGLGVGTVTPGTAHTVLSVRDVGLIYPGFCVSI